MSTNLTRDLMKNLLNYFVLTISLIFVQLYSFGQTTADSTNTIVGTWDVVIESNYRRYSKHMFDAMKKKKSNRGNHNIAIYRFSANDELQIASIKDFSHSDEEGTIIWNKDRSGFVRDVTFPRHLSERKRTKGEKIKTKILFLDSKYMVLKANGYVLYLTRMSDKG